MKGIRERVVKSSSFLENWPSAEACCARLDAGDRRFFASGLPLEAQAFFLSWLRERRPAEPWLVLAAGRAEAAALAGDLQAWLPREEVLFFPSWEVLPFDAEEADLELIGERQKTYFTLTHFKNTKPPIVVTSLGAFLQWTPPPEYFSLHLYRAAAGEPLPWDPLEQLPVLGYERVSQVVAAGQFAVRGNILDIAVPGAITGPVRMEREGEEIASLKGLDVFTQRSRGELKETWIFPARELVFSPELHEKMEHSLSRRETPEAQAALELWRRCGRFPGWMWHAALASPRGCLLDYFPEETLMFFSEPHALSRRWEDFDKRLEETDAQQARRGWRSLSARVFFQRFEILEKLHRDGRALAMGQLTQDVFGEKVPVVDFSARALQPYAGKVQRFFSDAKAWLAQSGNILIWCHNEGEAERLGELFLQAGLPLEPEGPIRLRIGEIEESFQVEKFWCLPDHDLFRRYRARRLRRRRITGAKPIVSFSELENGALAVHEDFGICRFHGLVPLTVDGVTQEYAQLEFADSEKLYLPVDQIARLQRYIGAADASLSRLGSEQWKKSKAKARLKAAEAARELLALYAARRSARKIPLGPDTLWQREFEESFAYESTPGQEKAVREIKKDMESSVPMDRLLCGDVGFGKTEVAMRAVFKAVQEGRQAAVLVPTTVLAQQHENTFRERMADYPVRVASLSRFKSQKEQKDILKRLGSGEIDVLIGTHRLLQDDVKFAKLGLLVVDEEHRFGVRAKERLKELRKEVDVLTLTATPIPRTLHMALSGLRSISILETPPRDRRPVHVHVGPFEESVVQEAVRRELERDGQVFYVHNRVQDILSAADRLHRLFPGVRIGIAHGQLMEHELESVMMDFLRREIQILVCTSIVESGLDFPNVNTLIVERSEYFGLSQLYQLKGRVGRTDRQAYAYFFFSPAKTLRETAQKRLETLQQLTALGSGLQVAMRDLEIRGAGAILGVAQHGTLESVGFDLYARLLAQETRRLQGEEVEEESDVEWHWDINAYLPRTYIPEESERLDIYRRLARGEESEEELEKELRDRYGPLPEAVRYLLLVPRFKRSAKQAGVRRLDFTGGWLRLSFRPDRVPPDVLVARWVSKWPKERLRFFPKDSLTVAFGLVSSGKDAQVRITALESFLKDMEKGLG